MKPMLIDQLSSTSLLTIVSGCVKNEEFLAAEVLCDEVISRKEFLGIALTAKAKINAEKGQHKKAIELYNEALAQGSDDDAVIRYHLALSLFSVGRQREGWYNLYRARTESETNKPLYVARKRFSKPLFDMQPPPAKVHIHTDAGFGDNIMLMRYLPLLIKRGYAVRYETKDSMVKLASDSLPNVEISTFADEYQGPLDFDYHLPIIELPFLFETGIETMPWSGSYIKPDQSLVEKYKSFRNKIGICWRTTVDIGYPLKKSVPFDSLKFIDDRFVSLVPGFAEVTNPLPNNPDWAETAALIENLDLVISVDTAIAHLAGAMGKPIWLMMHKYTTSFQFMAECPGASWNETSPWYPSMRIFRQKTRGDWSNVIETIATELRSFK